MEGVTSGENGVVMTLELRLLPVWAKSQLSRILESNPGWQDIMGNVPGEPWKPGEPIPEGLQYKKRYSGDDVKIIADECTHQRREGFEVLLEEWGTSGRKRPTVLDLVALMKKIELYRALDYLTVDVMKGEPVPRGTGKNPIDGLNQALENEMSHENVVFGTCTLKVDESPTLSSGAEAFNMPKFEEQSTMLMDPGESESGLQTEQAYTFDPEIIQGMDCSSVLHFSYSGLRKITNNFSEVLVNEGGNKLGEGAFGKVYLAQVIHEGIEKKVAIKRLQAGESSESRLELQFKTEIEVLSRCNHENLVPLLGYSCDGPEWCLVYTFMTNGSLQDSLSCDSGREKLDWKRRLLIGEGSARGIVYLHTFRDRPLVHRDIKSANILLDENLTPKVGDFGLVKLGGTGNNAHTVVKTTTVFGTCAYMPLEAFKGDVSVKLDTFSFGVVLLELLTGLPACDNDRENSILLDHVLETWKPNEGIDSVADAKAGNWDGGTFSALVDLAELCCKDSKKERPTMVHVLQMYTAIVHQIL